MTRMSVAVGVLIGAVGACAITMLFVAHDGNEDSRPDAAPVALEGIERVLAEVSTRLDRLDRTLARMGRLPVDGAPHSNTPPTHESESPPAVVAHSSATERRPIERDNGGQLPASTSTALRPLARWKDDQTERRRWLFREDSELVQAFGAPEDVTVVNGTEVWIYYERDGSYVVGEYRLRLSAGRLIDCTLTPVAVREAK